MRPGILAVRAVNEYRRRDLIGYIGLRYYLLATSARSDRWSREVACDLVQTRSTLPYRTYKVYKGVSERHGGNENAVIERRELRIPAPNEMLCEAALLDACSAKGGPFSRQSSVYSNVLCLGESREGMVAPYFQWWKQRQQAIADRCLQSQNDVVIYFDIKKFYPSISYSIVRQAWRNSVTQSGLERRWSILGENIIEDYRSLVGEHSGLPMGPMFAHMLGNLVLADFDSQLLDAYPNSYFRYVDDLALVIPKGDAKNVKDRIKALLPDGLQLNDPKETELATITWLQRTREFEAEVPTKEWLRLVRNLKAFMVFRSQEVPMLRSILLQEGFRLPFSDYATALAERPVWRRTTDWFKAHGWYRRRVKVQDASKIVKMAISTRATYFSRLLLLAEQQPATGGMERKFYIQRMRYLASRLLYLARPEQLPDVLSRISILRELTDLTAVYQAIITEDISDLVLFSESVTRGAAQVLASSERTLSCHRPLDNEDLVAAWAMFRLYGINFRGGVSSHQQPSAILSFVEPSVSPPKREMMNSFEDELLALRKGSELSPSQLLNSAFDEADQTIFDATLLLQGSS